VDGKLELEAWEKTGRIVEEGRQFFMLKVERLSGQFRFWSLRIFSLGMLAAV
jgi:hypothetical protein